jgi:hypothetical protein
MLRDLLDFAGAMIGAAGLVFIAWAAMILF